MRRKNEIDLGSRYKRITPSQYNMLLTTMEDINYDMEDWNIDDFHNFLDTMINSNSTIFSSVYVARIVGGDWDEETTIQFTGFIETPEGRFEVIIESWYCDPPYFETKREAVDYVVKLWDKYLDTMTKFRIMTSQIKYSYCV